VNLGTQGGTLANARENTADRARTCYRQGQGVGAGRTDLTGNLQIQGTNIGDETPLSVAGSAPAVRLTVAGDRSRRRWNSRVGRRRSGASGDVAIDLPGGGNVAIDGSIVDDGAHRQATDHERRHDRSRNGFFFDQPTHRFLGSTGSGEPGSRSRRRRRLGTTSVAGFSTAGDRARGRRR
jgi:hypothetical protein